MGSCCPMTPVDATSTCVGSIFSTFAASWAVIWQHSMPSLPVQALATPLLITTAWAEG